jgi:acetone carboxylase gamma subunit
MKMNLNKEQQQAEQQEQIVVCACGSVIFNILSTWKIRCFHCGVIISEVENEKVYPDLLMAAVSVKH